MPYGSLGTIWAEVGLNTQKLDQGLIKAELKLAKADKTVTTFGHKLTAQSTKLMIAGGLMAGAVAAVGIATVNMAKDFEKSMRNVNSISKLSEVEFAKMSGEVIGLSKTLPQSAKVLADGLYDIASSGFSGADGMKVLDASARAASAGLTDTATSAKGITAVLNAYGWEATEAARVSDTMFKTVDKGVITFEELSSTVGDWIGMAEAANLSFEEASGAIAYMTTKGISASEAGVSLTRMLTGIIKPSEEMAEMLRKAGYESGEMALQQLGLAGFMKLVNDETSGSITKMLELLPEIRGVRGANALLGAGYGELTDYMKEFNDTTGATAAALAEQSKSLDFQLTLLKNNISAIGITLGSELIPQVTETVSGLTEWISHNAKLVTSLIKVAGGATAAVGGILLMAGALGKLRAVALTHPIGLVIAAITALNIAVSAGADKLQEYETWWGDTGAAILSGFAPLPEAIDAFKNLSYAMGQYKEGNISFIEALSMTRREAEEQRRVQTDLENGIYDTTEAYEQAQRFIKKYSDELPVATSQMNKLVNQLSNGEISVEAFTIGIEDLQKATKNGHEDIKEMGEVTFLTSAEMRKMAAEADKSAKAVEGLGEETEETTQTINELLESLFKLYNLNQSTTESSWDYEEAQKALNEAIAEYGDGSKEAQEATFRLQDAREDLIDSIWREYSAEGTSLARQLELKQSFIELGRKAVENGEMTEESFRGMLDEFETTTTGIKGLVKDITGAISGIKGKSVDIDIRTKYTTSGSAPSYAPGIPDQPPRKYDTGGIVGMPNIPRAATGMNIPQTGNEHLILAHDYEVIANTSQQKNVADWFWNFINNPPNIGGKSVPIEIRVPIELDGRVIGESVSKFVYDGVNTRSRLGG
jgi:TP901 family phage tail tape measure protein